MFQAFKNLPSRTRLAVGVGILAWGGAGLYLSDRAEDKLGYKPSEKDREELSQVAPHITVVDKRPEES